jgi:hypothetical protein
MLGSSDHFDRRILLTDKSTDKLNVWPIYHFFEELKPKVQGEVLGWLRNSESLDGQQRRDGYGRLVTLVQGMSRDAREVLKDVPLGERQS